MTGNALQDEARSRRVRRSTEEVRALILAAAKDVFAESGYAGTSTRAIAKRCRVVEPLIFRHFGSKAGLFDAAVRVPFDEFLAEFADNWKTSRDVADVSNRASYYLDGLYERLLDNRKLLLALVRAAQEDEAELGSLLNGSGSPLDTYFTQIENLAAISIREVGWPGVDVHIAVRATFAMVVGMAMCDEWLFPSDREHPDRARIVGEMQQFMVHGLAHRG